MAKIADALVSDCRIPEITFRAGATEIIKFNQDLSYAAKERMGTKDHNLNGEKLPEWVQLSRRHWVPFLPHLANAPFLFLLH